LTDVRTDPLTGATVVVAEHRQERPTLPASGCPFCPGGLEAPQPYQVRWFVNRWPSMPDARCEIVVYAPEHEASLASLGVERATRVVELWAERTSALGGRPDVAYVLVFENRGPEVGATIAHPHGQIYALDRVPDAPAAELRAEGCALCETGPERSDALVVGRRGGWRAEVPWAAAWPFELLVSPVEHVPDLPSARAEAGDLAAVLVDSLARLDQLFDAAAPYMLWFHQRPTDGGSWPTAHLHAHVAPLWRAPGVVRYVAAGELGSGTFFNPVAPERAAARLRDLPGAG
jgi:UDPglucose--hexose-1-phosphate uridylyltransferase